MSTLENFSLLDSGSFDKAMKLLGQAISEVQKAEKNTKAVGKSINKAETAFKELGVKEPNIW